MEFELKAASEAADSAALGREGKLESAIVFRQLPTALPAARSSISASDRDSQPAIGDRSGRRCQLGVCAQCVRIIKIALNTRARGAGFKLRRSPKAESNSTACRACLAGLIELADYR